MMLSTLCGSVCSVTQHTTLQHMRLAMVFFKEPIRLQERDYTATDAARARLDGRQQRHGGRMPLSLGHTHPPCWRCHARYMPPHSRQRRGVLLRGRAVSACAWRQSSAAETPAASDSSQDAHYARHYHLLKHKNICTTATATDCQ